MSIISSPNENLIVSIAKSFKLSQVVYNQNGEL